MKSRYRYVLGLITLAALSLSFKARAEVDDDMKRAMARELGAEGLAAVDRNDWSTALDRLNRAYELHPVPTLALWTGKALAKLGRLVEAAERYREATQLGILGGNAEQQQQAQQAAQAAYDALLPRLARITIQVKGTLLAANEVTLDGRALPRAALRTKIPVDPGSHVVALSGPGATRREIDLAEGAQVVVELDVPATTDDLSHHLESPTPAPTRGDQYSAHSSSAQKTLGYVALGVGGAALGTFAVTGVLTLRKRSQLEQSCTGNICDPSYQSDLDSFRRYRTISSVGFIVGLVGAATGTVLLVTAPPRSDQSHASIRLTPRIGLGEIGLEGSY